MKTITVTQDVGEELGPVDWTHPMIAEVERHAPELVAALRDAEKDPSAFEATTDGGWPPRVGWGRVLRVVMYDGWPFWKPTPTVVSEGWYGSRHDHFDAITEIRRSK